MSTLLLSLVVATAQASTPTVLAPGSQPLADENFLVSALSAMGGAHLRSDSELSDLLETYEECDVVIRESGFMMRRIVDRVDSRASELSEAELAEVQEADLRILVDLGFDESEFDNIVTSEVGARDFEEGGSPGEARFIASKTFVDRSVAGASLSGSRVVVTRNADGDLVGVNAVWPVIETGAEFALTEDGIESIDDIPADLVPGTLRMVREVAFPAFDDHGVVISGAVLTEITYSVYRNEPILKAIYLLDGIVVNPLRLESGQ